MNHGMVNEKFYNAWTEITTNLNNNKTIMYMLCLFYVLGEEVLLGLQEAGV